MANLRFLMQAAMHLRSCGFLTRAYSYAVQFRYHGRDSINTGTIESKPGFLAYVEEGTIPPPVPGQFDELDDVLQPRRWCSWLANEQYARLLPPATQQLLDECCLLMIATGWTPPQDRYSAMAEMIETCLTEENQRRLRELVGQHM